jgi:hypothetical protein
MRVWEPTKKNISRKFFKYGELKHKLQYTELNRVDPDSRQNGTAWMKSDASCQTKYVSAADAVSFSNIAICRWRYH